VLATVMSTQFVQSNESLLALGAAARDLLLFHGLPAAAAAPASSPLRGRKLRRRGRRRPSHGFVQLLHRLLLHQVWIS
jgi:hypothetical protein